jgi:hypothetical protein
MRRFKLILHVVFCGVLLGIYYTHPTAPLSALQSVWLAFKVMLLVYGVAAALRLTLTLKPVASRTTDSLAGVERSALF